MEAAPAFAGVRTRGNPLRKLLQFVLIAGLLLSCDALTGAMMPCCAQAQATIMSADMQMQPAAGTSLGCHDASSSAPTSEHMSLFAAPMIRCPRAAANLQTTNEWASNERAEPHSPLQVASHLAAGSLARQPAAVRTRSISQLLVPAEPDLSTSLPLRL